MPGAKKTGKFKRKRSDDSMLAAVDAVRRGKFSFRQASLPYDIPKSLIKDHLDNESLNGKRKGRGSIVSYDKEKALAQWCVKMAEIGYGRNKKKGTERHGEKDFRSRLTLCPRT